MNLYIYSDESGVFDAAHNEYFVFAGIICFGKKQQEKAARMYSHAERVLRQNDYPSRGSELKASSISNKAKSKLFRSLNPFYKFCVCIEESHVHPGVYEHKKHKQRYLDYAYKMVLRKCLESLSEWGMVPSQEVRNIFVSVDEHSTATDGRYELREGLLNEFKNGTFNITYDAYFEPVFPNLETVTVDFCDSSKVFLIRASDIIANHCYHAAISSKGRIAGQRNMFVYYLPSNIIGSQGLEYFQTEQA